MRFSIVIVLILCGLRSTAQLFDHPEQMKLVKRTVDYIYNVQADSAAIMIRQVERRLPNHPSVPMLRALNLLWVNIPVVTVDSVFEKLSGYLRETIRLANLIDNGAQTHPEAIFFEMSARGLLAEYYADAGQYMKALSEAGKTYDLIKKGEQLAEKYPEFLLTSGVYNYFREKYPEKHPVYKPFMWVFRSGDVELGLEQIEAATRKGVLTKAEAYIYMAYIYLRYEHVPSKAQTYLWDLNKKYPANPYVKVKLVESLTYGTDFSKVPVSFMEDMIHSNRPYYKMAGNTFYGYYTEKVQLKPMSAIAWYKKALEAGKAIPDFGQHYRDMAHLGLGRVYAKSGDKANAQEHLNMVLDESEDEGFKKEAESLLKSL